MRNFIFHILSGLVVLCFCTSCSDTEKEHKFVEISELDFGEGTYRPNPFKCLDNIPPFSWMGMPDSVKKETELEISFNEDAIRSHSSGQIAFVDQNGNLVNGLTIGKNLSERQNIDAKSGNVIIPVSFTVNPATGDSTLNGSIVVLGTDLDQVNDTKLSSIATPIASWRMKHETGINWLRWTILILIIIAILAIVALILYGLFKLGVCIFVALSSAVESLSAISMPSFNSQIIRQNNNRQKDRKKNKNKDDIRKRNPFIVHCEHILLNSNVSLSDKATTLERLFIFWDYELPESDKDFEAGILDKRIMNAMDCLWYRNTFYKYTRKGMSWSGLELDSTLIPDPKVAPKNRNYSNIDNLTWGEIMDKHNYHGLTYHKGKPAFADIALYTIQLSNFDRLVDSISDTERGPLQEEAFKILAKNLHKTVEEVRLYKEQNRLVWHEDTDCKTLYLVPQEIHNNLHHFGGIGMLKILRKSGLF